MPECCPLVFPQLAAHCLSRLSLSSSPLVSGRLSLTTQPKVHSCGYQFKFLPSTFLVYFGYLSPLSCPLSLPCKLSESRDCIIILPTALLSVSTGCATQRLMVNNCRPRIPSTCCALILAYIFGSSEFFSLSLSLTQLYLLCVIGDFQPFV